jgi:hypothetical protein
MLSPSSIKPQGKIPGNDNSVENPGENKKKVIWQENILKRVSPVCKRIHF